MSQNKKQRLLWVDDEIEHLKSHIFFLQEKGYEIDTSTNGKDALLMLKENRYNLVFLDENMPGLSGLDTLVHIKESHPNLPVIMITKSEEESIMDKAIGSKIEDYLIKPVLPNQILLSIKKALGRDSLISKKTTTDYQSAFAKIGMQLNNKLDIQEWYSVYKQLVFWEIELQQADSSMNEILLMQKNEANNQFAKFIKDNYLDWLNIESDEAPLMSHHILRDRVVPLIKNQEKVAFIVIDNFRYDQWETIKKELLPFFSIKSDELYCSILPTATQYARNSIFSGLLPSNISKIRPDLWMDEDEEGTKNQFEEELINDYFERNRNKIKIFYEKINNNETGNKLIDNFSQIKNNDLIALVVNFVDMISHARTEMKVLKEIISDEASYRSLTKTWFMHSPLFELLKRFSEEKFTVIITTDHGTIRVQNPIKVVGDKNTNTNLRYKQGKNLAYDKKQFFEIKNPEEAFLPKLNISTSYIFATNNDFVVYPNNLNHYANHFKDTFQHGGISMEEIMIPFAILDPKN